MELVTTVRRSFFAIHLDLPKTAVVLASENMISVIHRRRNLSSFLSLYILVFTNIKW